MTKADQIKNIFNRLLKKIRSRISREFLIYLFFLLIAVVVWYFNALNKNYTTDLRFKINYENLPDDKVLVNAPPGEITLTVNAQGFTLVKYQMSLRLYPLVVDASYSSLRHLPNAPEGSYYITTQTIFDLIDSQLSSDIRLGRISPDTLHFFFSEMVQKEVLVKSTIDLQYEKQFLPKGNLRLEPSTVTVSGPSAIVDTMKFVYTKAGKYKKLKDTLKASVALQPVDMLKYSEKEVTLIQPVEKHTEATLNVPIEAINLPEGLVMKTFPGTVMVNCMVAISEYEKLQAYQFRAVVDYNAIADIRENQAKIKVNLVKSPDYVSDVRFHPKNVEFIVEK